jgi:hypothetical protein
VFTDWPLFGVIALPDVVRVWNRGLVLPIVLVTRRTSRFPPGTPGRTGPAGR